MEGEDQRKKKSEQNHRREDEEMSECLNTCTVWVFWFWYLAWITSRTSK